MKKKADAHIGEGEQEECCAHLLRRLFEPINSIERAKFRRKVEIRGCTDD